VINSNLPPSLHLFRDIAVNRSKIAILGYPSSGVKLLLMGCGSPTEIMAEIKIPVSHQVAIAHVKLFLCSFWATVCKTVRPMLSDRCLSVLSVTLVYCAKQLDGPRCHPI